MRFKLVLAALFFLLTSSGFAQVAPAVKIGGIPLGIGFGLSDFNTDYYRPNVPYWNGRMLGVSAWLDYSLPFRRGLGVEVEGTSIFANKPSPVELPGRPVYGRAVREDSAKGGVIYRFQTIHKFRPYVKGLGGIASVDFYSRNPFYTHDTYLTYVAGGGVEYRAWNNIFVRGDYERQWVPDFLGGKTLNPNGFTVGATYYLRGEHRHY